MNGFKKNEIKEHMMPTDNNNTDTNESYVNEKPKMEVPKITNKLKKEGTTTLGNLLARFWKVTSTPYIPAVEISHQFDDAKKPCAR